MLIVATRQLSKPVVLFTFMVASVLSHWLNPSQLRCEYNSVQASET